MTLHTPIEADSDNEQLKTKNADSEENSFPLTQTEIDSKQQNLTQATSSQQPFLIEKKIGEGAVGIVYQAKDIQLNRLIALKVFRSKKVSFAAREQMLDEARLASALNHPNIVTIYDVSRDHNHCFIAMEWIEGNTLEYILALQNKKGSVEQPNVSLTLLEKISYARQIASGLSCAHQMDIIHRDLKPSNIMIRSQDPKIKILDFGIAEISQGSVSIDKNSPLNEKLNLKHGEITSNQPTNADQQETQQDGQSQLQHGLRGTIGYMSPEQTLGEQLTPRSDIFAFGIILYQLFYGEHPFLKDKPEQTLAAIRRQSPTFILKEISTDKTERAVPKSIQILIKQCLEKAIEKRPGSASDISASLKIIETQEKLKIANSGWRFWITSWRLAVLLIFSVAAYWSINHFYFNTQVSRAEILQQGKTIAVLPFDIPSGDPMLAVFAQGLSVSLSNELALVGEKNKGAWVIPATEIAKQKDTSVSAIYNKYNPELVLSGSIQHMGNIRRLSISILNASDSKLIQSSVHDIPIDKILESQKEIRDAILKLLNWKVPKSLSEHLDKYLAQGSNAYQHYLQGLGLLYRYDYKDNLDAAINEFKQAIEQDPKFLDATQELARAYIRAAKIRSDSIWTEQAQHYANIGLQIAPNNSYSHSVLADVYYVKTQYENAMASYQKSIELEQNNASAYSGLAQVYKHNGEMDKAEATYKRSLTINEDWLTLNYLAVFYYNTNQFNKAEAIYNKLQVLTPNNEFAFQINGASQLGRGDYVSAEKTFSQAIRISPSANNISNLGTVQFYLKKYHASIKSFKDAVKKQPDNYVLWYNLGDAYKWSDSIDKSQETYAKSLALLNKKITIEPNKRYHLLVRVALLARLGRCEIAIKEFAQIDSIADSFSMILSAQIFKICNQPVEAIKWINLAIQDNYPLQSIKDEPELSELFTSQFAKNILTK